MSGCGMCPQLQSSNEYDASRFFWKQKMKHFNNIRSLSIVTPSKWLYTLAKQSKFFKNRDIHHIPNTLDVDIFQPINKHHAKLILNVKTNDKVILFGAVNFTKTTYKGFDLLAEALQKLKEKTDKVYHLLLFGELHNPNIKYDLPFPYTSLGRITDEKRLSLAYNCADVFVGPSRQDNFPSTFVEAISCGVPSVGFNIGGIPEVVEHKKNGYIATPFDVKDLAEGIYWCLENNSENILGNRAREKAVNEYSFAKIGEKYFNLYKSLIQ
jgi:glycosyltransferase involved in cell wall biosynthesis